MPERVNHYVLDRLIAEGGTAKVYWGVDLHSGFPVAIKELKIRHFKNATIRQKFKEMEAQLYLYASHPNIPRLVDFLDFEDRQQMYIIMEFIEGKSLEHYIYRNMGLIPAERALPMFMQILDTVAFLHRIRLPHLNINNGILHLDIKSNNVMIQPNGRIKLIDLGIASRLSDASTNSGFGTPAYMPPEQFEMGRVGKYTDIFALGILLFEMLTGHLPFTSNNPHARQNVDEIRHKIKYEPTPMMNQYYPRIDMDLQSIVNRALCKSPYDRFQSCEDFANRIQVYMRRHNIN